MQILFFRHGIAEDQSPDGGDESRRLTPEGIRKTKAAARGLANFIDKPDVILTSPKTRAAHTAAILAKQLGLKAETLPELGGRSAARLVERLRRHRAGTIVAVGHEPSLSEAVELLCTGGGLRGFIDLRKAGCACVELVGEGGHRGRLLWLASARLLRKLA